MNSHLRNYSKIILIMLALGLSQCGQKSKSSEVTITGEPTQPIVFSSDLTTVINGNKTTVKAPWFKFKVHVNNTSDTSVTVVGLHIEITGAAQGGTFQTTTVDFDPSLNDFSNDAMTCNYTDFGQFDPGGNSAGPSFNNVDLFVTGATGTGCPTGDVSFYVGGLPKPPDGSNNYSYQVKVQPMGWFGTRNSQVDRFTGFGYVFTQ